MSDMMQLRQIRATTTLGVLPHEQQQPQPVWVDLTFAVDVKQVTLQDNLAATTDYSVIARTVVKWLYAAHYQLLETAVEQLAEYLLQRFKLPWVELCLTKCHAIPNASGVSLTIKRYRDGHG